MARTGDFNPERDGAFDSLSRLILPPLIDNSGGVVFEPTGGQVLRGCSTLWLSLWQRLADAETRREGDLLPDGTGPIILGETIYRANSVGQVAFTTQGARLLRAGPAGVVEIASIEHTLPDGNVSHFLYTPDINDSGESPSKADSLTLALNDLARSPPWQRKRPHWSHRQRRSRPRNDCTPHVLQQSGAEQQWPLGIFCGERCNR